MDFGGQEHLNFTYESLAASSPVPLRASQAYWWFVTSLCLSFCPALLTITLALLFACTSCPLLVCFSQSPDDRACQDCVALLVASTELFAVCDATQI